MIIASSGRGGTDSRAPSGRVTAAALVVLVRGTVSSRLLCSPLIRLA